MKLPIRYEDGGLRDAADRYVTTQFGANHRDIQVILAAVNATRKMQALAEYYAAAEHARHWPAGPNHIEAEQRLRAARTAVQDLLEKS